MNSPNIVVGTIFEQTAGRLFEQHIAEQEFLMAKLLRITEPNSPHNQKYIEATKAQISSLGHTAIALQKIQHGQFPDNDYGESIKHMANAINYMQLHQAEDPVTPEHIINDLQQETCKTIAAKNMQIISGNTNLDYQQQVKTLAFNNAAVLTIKESITELHMQSPAKPAEKIFENISTTI